MGRLFLDPRERHAREHAALQKEIRPKKMVGPRACAMAAIQPKRSTLSKISTHQSTCADTEIAIALPLRNLGYFRIGEDRRQPFLRIRRKFPNPPEPPKSLSRFRSGNQGDSENLRCRHLPRDVGR